MAVILHGAWVLPDASFVMPSPHENAEDPLI
jgi:hypothetical protein